jgi:hypothetical protein
MLEEEIDRLEDQAFDLQELVGLAGKVAQSEDPHLQTHFWTTVLGLAGLYIPIDQLWVLAMAFRDHSETALRVFLACAVHSPASAVLARHLARYLSPQERREHCRGPLFFTSPWATSQLV